MCKNEVPYERVKLTLDNNNPYIFRAERGGGEEIVVFWLPFQSPSSAEKRCVLAPDPGEG